MIKSLVFALLLAAPVWAVEERVPAPVEPARAELPALPAPLAFSDPAYLPALPAPSSPALRLAADPASAPLAVSAVAADHPFVAQARFSVARQLDAMAQSVGRDEALMSSISETASAFLGQINGALKAGEIDPTVDLRMHADDAVKPTLGRTVRVGFYPVAADPFHWGHLLIGFQAMAKLKLDKVVFVLAGDDPRKPNMTPASLRHPMGQEVLASFAPFFAYSSIALGTNHDGETNLFRFLAENSAKLVNAFYLVGDDHYRLKDKNGNDDTIPKIEKNRAKPEFRFDPETHQVSLAFIAREGRVAEHVPTGLEVQFLPNIPFEASSTHIRNGRQLLMPWDAFDWVARNGLGLYGIAPAQR